MQEINGSFSDILGYKWVLLEVQCTHISNVKYGASLDLRFVYLTSLPIFAFLCCAPSAKKQIKPEGLRNLLFDCFTYPIFSNDFLIKAIGEKSVAHQHQSYSLEIKNMMTSCA